MSTKDGPKLTSPDQVKVEAKEPKKEEQKGPDMIEMSKFFTYATRWEKTLMILGTIGAIVAGFLLPCISIAMGAVTNTYDPRNSQEQVLNDMRMICLYISLTGIGCWIFGYIYYAFWQHLAQNLSFDLRSRYLKAILQQEVAYFEKSNVEQLPSQIGDYFFTITESIGEKYSNIIFSVATLVCGVGISIYLGADFAGVCAAFIPIILTVVTIFGAFVKKTTIAKMGIMKRLGGVIEESLTAVRLIASFANEEKEEKKFEKLALEVKDVAHKAEFWMAFIVGIFKGFIFGYYVYSFYLASIYMEKGKENPCNGYKKYDVGKLLSVLVSFMTGMMQVFGLTPNIQALIQAKMVGKKIFEIIDRVPEIKDHDRCIGNFDVQKGIRFEKVTFKYPTAAENVRDVLERMSFTIKAGETTAIVGPSGSGKSTIVQMIERFYAPREGDIYFDDLNIKDIKLKTLRESIGYVSQEPVLILGTIKDNLLFGDRDATDEQIKHALQQANASFIYEMVDKLNTYIGSAAVLNMSGGQKQRIAIARALIKKPKILILDEATSALDPKSEKEVQDAVDAISNSENNRMTIVMIAHRLQTIMTAKNLLYIDSKNTMLAGTKGTREYDEIMQKLQEESYKHQAQQDPQEYKQETAVNSEFEVPEALPSMSNLQKQPSTKDPSTVYQDDFVPSDISMGRIMSYYSPIWMAITGIFVSIINAFSFPVYGMIYAKLLFVLMVPFSPNFKDDRDYWCGMFLLLVFGIGIVSFLQKYVFMYVGENLTYDVRFALYKGIIYKNIAWFDNKDRAPGILSSVLSEDIGALNGMTTEHLAILLEAALGLIIGIIISMLYTWKMGLIALALCPFVFLGGIMTSRLAWKVKPSNKQDKNAQDDPYNKSNALLSDIIMNYRTVIGFGEKNVEYLLQKYDALLEEPKRLTVKASHLAGFYFGYGQCVRFIFVGVVFYISAEIVARYHDDQVNTYIGVNTLFVAALGSGISIASAPSIGKAKEAAKKIFAIIDHRSKIDTRDVSGVKEIKRGEIEFQGTDFQYPSRTNRVLNAINLKIPATKKIALVGHSGCGKSTIANLLLRLYDVTGGKLLIDGIDIREYNVKELRRQIGIVMQEPLLFNTTIKENILYGNEQADDAKVRQVAQMANALQFIESNIEDLEKEDVQKEIAKKYIDKVNDTSKKYPKIGQLGAHYQEDIKDDSHFSFEQMRLAEEVLVQADEKLKSQINGAIDLFIQVVQLKSKVKGCRWDDIVTMFEYKSSEYPVLLEMIKKSNMAQRHKNYLSIRLTDKHELDREGLVQVIQDIEIIEESSVDYDRIIQRVGYDAQERIKHAGYTRLQELTRLQEESGTFQLHEGFNKECGLKGSKLSGGQKQRIAIARALIKDPKILILDEATSALDEKSQEIVQQALDRAMEGRTSIVIAHRLSTIRNCEWLFVIHKGKVVEQGTYETLSADPNSHFYKLKSGMEM